MQVEMQLLAVLMWIKVVNGNWLVMWPGVNLRETGNRCHQGKELKRSPGSNGMKTTDSAERHLIDEATAYRNNKGYLLKSISILP